MTTLNPVLAPSPLTDADWQQVLAAQAANYDALITKLRQVLGLDSSNLLLAAENKAAALAAARAALEMARQYVADASPAVGCEAAVDAVLADALAQIGGAS
jgi:hypothetical protein